MLTLTENASDIVKTIAQQTVGTADGGLRISSQGDGSEALSVTAVAGPEPGDQVVDSAGAKVFLESEAAQALDDKVLDAQVDSAGGVQFALGSRQGPAPDEAPEQ